MSSIFLSAKGKGHGFYWEVNPPHIKSNWPTHHRHRDEVWKLKLCIFLTQTKNVLVVASIEICQADSECSVRFMVSVNFLKTFLI